MSIECMSLPPLKPCPFCGGEAEIMEDVWHSMYYVRCEGESNNCEVISETKNFVTEREAIEAWNRRAGELD